MIHRPPEDLRLWDTWILPAEGLFHLYHLQGPKGASWDSLGHATSTDLIHWELQDSIPTRGPEGAWDAGTTLTGMAFPHDDGYAMAFGSNATGDQLIGVMFSDDLQSWTKHPANPVLKPAPPYVERDDWRDAYVHRVAGTYEALVCARLTTGESCVARMQSTNLVDWTALPPLVTPDAWQCEVPEYFSIGGKHYVIFSVGKNVTDASRSDGSGTLYMLSDSPDDGYAMPDANILLGSGSGRRDCYVGRTIEAHGQRILYYHNCGERPSLGAPKIVHQNEDGSIELRYWDVLAALETGAAVYGLGAARNLGAGWTLADDVIKGAASGSLLRGTLGPPLADLHLDCAIELASNSRAGVVFRHDDAANRGLALVLDEPSSSVEIARLTGGELSTIDIWRSAEPLSMRRSIRVFARSEFADCYLDDRLIFSTVIDDAPRSGRAGFLVASGSARFSNPRLASLEPQP